MKQRLERLQESRLYLVCGDQPDEFLDAVLEAGVDILQLREKELEAAPILAIAERFKAACERHGALFVVNDRVDLALASAADGVHLGQNDIAPAAARALAGAGDLIVGRSTHTPAELFAAATEPVDYVCAGPVFATPTKPGRAATGLDLVRLAAKECPKPWFAIGGIDADKAGEICDAGATRIVVVRAVTTAADPVAAVVALRAALPA